MVGAELGLRPVIWIFGYGSLVWRPDFEHVERHRADLTGFARRFWQASTDHRGTPEKPGIVVTLVPDASAITTGVAYGLAPNAAEPILRALDYRERGGYSRESVPVALADGRVVDALVYRGTSENPNYLGALPLPRIAAQIRTAVGPSGPNPAYVFELHRVLLEMGVEDPHVAGLAALLAQDP